MSEWREYELGEVVELFQGLAINKQTRHLLKETGLPLLRITDMFSNSYSQFIDPVNVPQQCIARESEVIFTRTGQVGFVFKGKIGVIHNNCFKVKPKENLYDDFLFWFLKQPAIKELSNNIASGSVQLDLPHSAFKSIPIQVPSFQEQKAIASVLSSLDDKIDLLHRQNKTLEAMAEILFRQWFVEDAEDDWEEVPITELFEVRDGTHDSPKQSVIGKPLITSKHILDGQLDIANAYLISENDFNKINQRSKVDTGDILFSMIGTIGLIYFEQSALIDYAIKNIGLFKTSQNPDWTIFTFLWLKSPIGRQFIDEHKSGSTQEYVALGSMRSIVFQKPPIEILRKFNKLASSYFAKIKLNHTQIRTLEALRDALLPKLMSGEVRVVV
ncbi:MAG: restriction endonuclease subunit S [Nitrosomonas sp. PRO4]|nr:restriction endonuclease subunit S [Nitrosomonas sp. PRO4]